MMVDNEPLKVLVVEDDEDDFYIAQRLLSRATGMEAQVQWARSYAEGLDAITARPYDVALVDYRLKVNDGLDLLRKAHEQGCYTPIILLTGQDDREVDLRAMEAGASDYLVKWEFDARLLERSLRYARERKRAAEHIREQAAFLDKARDAISAYDLEKRVIYWNKSAERLTGWAAKEMMGRTSAPLYEQEDPDHERAWEGVRRKGEWVGELRQRTKRGGEIVVESRWTLVRDGAGKPKSVLVINTDITERKKLESQFLRAQRMESIGRLVSGIAHDLGNLLIPILLGVKVLQQRYPDEEKTVRTLAMMQQSGQRGADMIKQVLAFARGVQGEHAPLDPEDIVYEVGEMVRETFPKTIKIETQMPATSWRVKGDSTQLQQVLMNLCMNARDAMLEGGYLTISIANETIDQAGAKMHLEAHPGEYVRLSVVDTGWGIPPDAQDKIFEPFFTTKPAGLGTGLGLSTVYSIVKSHGGFVGFQSEGGKGSTFDVFLPVALAIETAREEEGLVTMQAGRGELVLVVDDEVCILEAMQETLHNAGYQVLTARNGKEALALFEQRPDEIDAVLTDLLMPEMGGLETIRALRNRCPHLPILATSGMSDELVQQALDAGAHAFLPKPFTADKLCEVLTDLLAQRQVSWGEEK